MPEAASLTKTSYSEFNYIPYAQYESVFNTIKQSMTDWTISADNNSSREGVYNEIPLIDTWSAASAETHAGYLSV